MISDSSESKVTIEKSEKRSTASTIGNVVGVLFCLSAIYLIASPEEPGDRGIGFVMLLFAVSITDFYLPLLKDRLNEKWIRRVRWMLPFVIIFGSAFISALFTS